MLHRSLSRFTVLCLTLSFCLFVQGCKVDLLRVARVAMVATPLVDSLVASGVLPAEVGRTVTTDFADGAAAIGDFALALRAIPKDDPDKIEKQATAAQLLATRWDAIVKRGHFGVHSRVNDAFRIADGLLKSIIAYYDPASRTDAVSASAASREDLSEQDFYKTLEPDVERLKQALQP